MCNRDAAAEAAGILHLDRDINEAVAIKVAEPIDGIERRREHELLTETGPAQRAVRPERDACEGSRRKLGIGRGRPKHEAGREKHSGHHVFSTRVSPTSLPRPRGSSIDEDLSRGGA